jgi:hypothetical protein
MLDITAVLLVAGFLIYAGVVFLKPDAVLSDTEKMPACPELTQASGQNPADCSQSPSACSSQLADAAGSDFDFMESPYTSLEPAVESDFYISSSHAHLLDEVQQSLPALTVPDRSSSGSSSSHGGASTSTSSPSGSTLSGGASGGGGTGGGGSSGGKSSSPTNNNIKPSTGNGAGAPNPQEVDDFLADFSDLPQLLADMDFSFPDTHFGKGKTYYVSPTGSDNNSGTSPMYPFKTIQMALNTSKGGRPIAYDVIIVAPGKYVVDPIRITKSNTELVFEKGVEIEARPIESNIYSSTFGAWGTFEHTHSCLIETSYTENIIIRGYGAILRMEKDKYMHLPIEHRKEFRAGVRILAGKNITISGLVICDTGGDGISLEGTDKNDRTSYNQNITIRNTVIDSAYRNAIGVISVDGLLIEHCVLRNTRGTRPESGIIFEPCTESHRFKNIIVRNVKFSHNNESAMYIQADKMTSASEPIDMLFEDLYIENDKGIQILRFFDNKPKITLTFRDLVMLNTFWGVQLYVSAKTADITFENCIWSGIINQPPVFIYSLVMPEAGGITFLDCQIFDNQKRPAILFSGGSSRILRNVQGTVYIENNQQNDSYFETLRSDLINVDVKIINGIADFVPVKYHSN